MKKKKKILQRIKPKPGIGRFSDEGKRRTQSSGKEERKGENTRRVKGNRDRYRD